MADRVERLRQRFAGEAESAQTYLNDIHLKAKQRSTYQMLYDEFLAKFYVYDGLVAGISNASNTAVAGVLRRMAERPLPSPRGVYDQDRFEEYRQQYIQALLSEFSES